jgi:hypothetical protein
MAANGVRGVARRARVLWFVLVSIEATLMGNLQLLLQLLPLRCQLIALERRRRCGRASRHFNFPGSRVIALRERASGYEQDSVQAQRA